MKTPTPPPAGLLRLPHVLQLVPVSKSSWWSGVKSGKYPKPHKLGPRTTCWLAADIMALINKASNGGARNDP